ncbi:MmgE/PrpD family protein [Bordetella bronchiseptica]|uniref:MmgE/PrpD family protein n=1 Tax=Bordetella bronchiseptica TaxID=518 RepID=UPI00081C8895|nr:MmgE/PrpD family protein [Bordetella bronchiseptica]AOB28289.1 hypothetical protein BBB44_19540 [Bordetella bronchiseptica]AZW45631.1 hypothetical protein CWR61_19695 [Bordetella bronchiseptica]
MNSSAPLIDFAHDLRYEDIPVHVRSIVREQIIATVGSILGGAQLPVAKSFENAIQATFGRGESSAFGAGTGMSAASAALYNSGLAQILDWEDWVLISHVGAAVVPVAWALAEERGLRLNDVVAAVTVGNEIAGRTSRAIQRGAYLGNGLPNHQIELPLVAGRLLGLDRRQLGYALGHSCYMAMENCPVGWTSDSKLLVNGLPAMWAIASANMAQQDIVGRGDIVEHPAGYLATVSESIDFKELTRDIGVKWYTETLSTKKHAGCAYNLPAAECAMSIRDEIAPEDVERIVVECSTATLYVGGRYDDFEPGILDAYEQGLLTHVGLCFDTKFCVAAAYVHGDLIHEQYLVENATDARVKALYGKISLVPSARLQKAQFQDFKYGATVTVHARDGRTATRTVEQMLGGYDRPFDHATKLADGARGLLAPETVDRIVARLRDETANPLASEISKLINGAP